MADQDDDFQFFQAGLPGAAQPAGARGAGRGPRNGERTSKYLITGVINGYAWPKSAGQNWPPEIQRKFTTLTEQLSVAVSRYFKGPTDVIFRRIRLRVNQENRRTVDDTLETSAIQPGDIIGRPKIQGSSEVGHKARGRRLHFHIFMQVTHRILVNTDGEWGLSISRANMIQGFEWLRPYVPDLKPDVDVLARVDIKYLSSEAARLYTVKEQLEYAARNLGDVKRKLEAKETVAALEEISGTRATPNADPVDQLAQLIGRLDFTQRATS